MYASTVTVIVKMAMTIMPGLYLRRHFSVKTVLGLSPYP